MTTSTNNILLLFAHPSLHRSEVNLPLFNRAQQTPGVTCIDLYREYPHFSIDADIEQQRLLEHEIIIFMFPLYWYSTPALLKEWQDLVLEYGFAYGAGGNALQGKHFFCAVTTGGQQGAYQYDCKNKFTLKEFLLPIEQMAQLTGMRYLPPFALFGARSAIDEGRLSQHLEDWQQLLTALREGHIDIDAAQQLPLLNQDLSRLLGNHR
ncbi:Kef-type potassium/proton antiporter accessory protein (CPA2 family) [Sinobacterium caligoides]|uniref:Kef-type potassium/proton antiporter accessory protein (CPA2 family) n=1 Tax=Sinobacterium caligoides TaxID=933926 RepID=A0A3N2DJY0_9GAMM|nr:NAD(P)H-dependent oxidoreductase [Sinobacterium caligoides]ROS00110.1 Kef-type potassium/proton antiporter accessory protein (CPA2 family) [Sinobacterium caligoides]